ncbi:MAG: RNA polymerase sigma factor [Acidobacteriota bacterium]
MHQGSGSTPAEAKLNEIIEEYCGYLRSVIVRFCPRGMGIQVDDVEQEARIRVWQALNRESGIQHFPSYLYRVAVNATIDAIRRIRSRREEQLEGSQDQEDAPVQSIEPGVRSGRTPEEITQAREVLELVESTLASLPNDRRRAVGLYLQGLTSQEIADLLRWTEPRARNLLYRGLRELREKLRNRGIDYEMDY